MTIKKTVTNNSIWWVDLISINFSNINFCFNSVDNIYHLSLDSDVHPIIIYILRYLPQTISLNTLDMVLVKQQPNNQLYCVLQAITSNIKLILSIKQKLRYYSTTTVFLGNTWIERELREFSGINFNNLQDTRKLLLNYNYNNEKKYTQFSTIISDINI